MNAFMRPISTHVSCTQRHSNSFVTSLSSSTPVRCLQPTKAARHNRVAGTSSGHLQRPMALGRAMWLKSESGGATSSKTRLRGFHASAASRHLGIDRPSPGTGIKVYFQTADGKPIKTCEVNEGDNLLAIAHEYDVDLEGACEGSVACSTCHVILEPETYDILPEPEDDENDMLDMAFGLTDTSRLGCQVKVMKEMDGMTVKLPAATRNMFVDGKKTSH